MVQGEQKRETTLSHLEVILRKIEIEHKYLRHLRLTYVPDDEISSVA